MKNKGKDGTEAFDELPVAFQAELSFETYQNMILQVDTNIVCLSYNYNYIFNTCF